MHESTAGVSGEELLYLSLERRQALKLEFERVALPQRPYLYSMASSLTQGKQRAEDLVQETYLRAFRFFHKFQPGSNCKAWLLCILRRVFINRYWRRKKGLKRVECEQIDHSYDFLVEQGMISERDNPEEYFLTRLMDDEVAAAMDELPGEFRVAVILVDIQERSYDEAARTMGCPVGTVRSRVSRARRLLAHSLKDYARRCGFSGSRAASWGSVPGDRKFPEDREGNGRP